MIRVWIEYIQLNYFASHIIVLVSALPLWLYVTGVCTFAGALVTLATLPLSIAVVCLSCPLFFACMNRFRVVGSGQAMIGVLGWTDWVAFFLGAFGVFGRGVFRRDLVSSGTDSTLGDCRISNPYFMNWLIVWACNETQCFSCTTNHFAFATSTAFCAFVSDIACNPALFKTLASPALSPDRFPRRFVCFCAAIRSSRGAESKALTLMRYLSI